MFDVCCLKSVVQSVKLYIYIYILVLLVAVTWPQLLSDVDQMWRETEVAQFVFSRLIIFHESPAFLCEWLYAYRCVCACVYTCISVKGSYACPAVAYFDPVSQWNDPSALLNLFVQYIIIFYPSATSKTHSSMLLNVLSLSFCFFCHQGFFKPPLTALWEATPIWPRSLRLGFLTVSGRPSQGICPDTF